MGLKIACLVPSWTESFIELGFSVVGRTRYCIHPKNKIESIPILGGTKKVDWSKLKETPDLVIFDKEENTKDMAESCPFPYWASHIRNLSDIAPQLQQLAQDFQLPQIEKLSARWQKVLRHPSPPQKITPENKTFPGLIRWFHEPECEIKKIAYFVWRKPWMLAKPSTFIGSMLKHCGFDVYDYPSDKNYPEIELEKLLAQPDLGFFFSSEPYPFEKREHELKNFRPACALVDGEAFSWFGLRSLEFLEKKLMP